MAAPTNLKYLESMKAILQTPVIKQLLFMLGVAAGVTVGIVLYMSIQEPLYHPLDYQVNTQNMAAIVDTLDKAGVRYKINDQDGIVYVAAKDLQLAKLKLSSSGIPKDDGFTYSFLNEQNAIGNSQFLENARYLRALENDLSKTISALEGISAARVHIAIPQGNVFADENGKPTASVVLSMAPGLTSDKEKVRAIVQIVASSVPGLDPNNVAITDQYGHYLSSAFDQNSIYNAEQLTYQNNMQNYYEKRIESMIIPIIGENKVTVRVHANIDFTQQEEAKEQYDPDKKVVRSEQSVSESTGSSGAASGPPGSLSNSPPTSDSEKQPSAAPQSSTSQGRNESVKNYELSKSVSYKKSNFAKITGLSVAVVVDNEVLVDPKTHKSTTKPLDQDKINKITELVKATIGFDEKRGDRVTVVNSSFNDRPLIEAASPTPLWEQLWFWDLIKKFVGMVIGFAFLYFIYKRLSNHMRTLNQPSQIRPSVREQLEEGGDNNSKEMHAIKQEQINRLKELAAREPDRVAVVIKNWVGKQ